ncbi:MAG: efflux RND transporter periplasmic adaptor subunit [Mailhella sp.]|nr:efflux RND transporter periplasmic adaptor subunit [Mailhella sp.]
MKKLILLFLAAAISVWGWQYMKTQQQTEHSTEIRLYGNVDIRQISLAFELSGRITDMFAEEGDAVKKGQSLASLDVRTLELQAEKTAAEIAAQEQLLLKLRNGSRIEEIARAEAALETAQASLEQAVRNEQRLTKLRRQNSVSQMDLETAQTALRVARGQKEEAKQTLALLQAGSRSEDIAMAAAQLKAARASLALIQHSIAQGELTAPADAIVSSRLLEPGDMASPASPVFLLSLMSPKWIRAYVTETQLGKIRPGMAAIIQTDSFPEAIPGSIGYISSTAEFTPKSVQTEELRTALLYEVRVVAKDPRNILRLGMPVTVIIPKQDGTQP